MANALSAKCNNDRRYVSGMLQSLRAVVTMIHLLAVVGLSVTFGYRLSGECGVNF